MQSILARTHAPTRLRLVGLLALLATAASATPSLAGCGCEKPPPTPAQVRPAVLYSGGEVTLFGAFTPGAAYQVTFTSHTGASSAVNAVAVNRRDLSDAITKAQLPVVLPALPLGPARISAKPVGSSTVVVSIPDTAFTVAPPPIALPGIAGKWSYPGYQAAVGRDGVTYITLDMQGLQEPLVLETQATGYPLRFTAEDAVFWNAQGFVMQLLAQPKRGLPIPGTSVFAATSPSTQSELLRYSRHEFATYFLQHAERLPHAVDPADPHWHADGSRHIDHDHLILAINGTVGGKAPAAGATPAFELAMNTYSLFSAGLVGSASMSISGSARTNSYDPATRSYDGPLGNVFTNGTLTVKDTAVVNGSAVAKRFAVKGTATVTGAQQKIASSQSFMAVQTPLGLPSLGKLVADRSTAKISAPGSYVVDELLVDNGGWLIIDNSKGPVTLYVRGPVKVGSGVVLVLHPDPERFAIYVAGSHSVSLAGDGFNLFTGVVYAPNSTLSIGGKGRFFGAFVGKSATLSESAKVSYFAPLAPESAPDSFAMKLAQ